MSETPVGEMEAGRDLDVLVLEAVFGFPRKKVFVPEWGSAKDWYFIPSGKPKRTHMIDARPVPRFSTEIADAWQVMEAMRLTVGPTDGRWFAAGFDAHETADMEGSPYIDASPHILAVADTAPLAICIAAIAAIEAGTVPTRKASVPTPAPRAPGE